MLTFCWTGESETFDPVHDFSVNDDTPLGNAGAAISAAHPFTGTNSLYFPNSLSYYEFAAAGIVNQSVGAGAYSVYLTEWDVHDFVRVHAAIAPNDYMKLRFTGANGTGGVLMEINRTGSANATLSVGGAMAINTHYSVGWRWDVANTTIRLELYDAAGQLIDWDESAVVPANAFPDDTLDVLRFGDTNGVNGDFYMDVLLFADVYAEQLENNLSIASYTQYNAGGDTTAPILTNPGGIQTGPDTAAGQGTTDEANGTFNWVMTQSATAPTVAQVQAGQDHTGANMPAGRSGNQPVTATGVQNVAASGLLLDVPYYFHFQHQDTATNDSTVVTSPAVVLRELPVLPIAIKEHQTGAQIATGGFMDGDSDADGDALSYEITQRPTHGVLTELIGGAFDYLPNAGYVGPDEFRYRPWAGGEQGAEYTVSIDVTGDFRGVLPTTQIQLKSLPLIGDFPVEFNGVLPTLKLPINIDRLIGAQAPVNAVLPTDKLRINQARLSAVIEPGVLIDYGNLTYNLTPELTVRQTPLQQFAGTDNASVLVITANGSAVNLGVLTRAVMTLKSETGTVVVDSDAALNAFDWTSGNGKLLVRLGNIAAVTAGRWSAQLVLYDTTHDDGIVWGENFLVIVE